MKSFGMPLLVSLALMSFSSACVTPEPAKFGVQEEQLAQIPARIAVLPCRSWPQGALYSGQSKLELPEAELTALCGRFDKFVLDGFGGQPYMRGLSPSVVGQLLKRAIDNAPAAGKSQVPSLDQLEQLWYRPGQPCEACKNSVSYYREVVAVRQDWRSWLGNLSRSTSSSDAILLPFVTEARAEVVNDRGVYYASRSASLVLMLIDSNNGDLIWAGGKQGEVRLPLPGQPQDPKAVALPTWEEIDGRIFVPELWAEFPGRQG